MFELSTNQSKSILVTIAVLLILVLLITALIFFIKADKDQGSKETFIKQPRSANRNDLIEYMQKYSQGLSNVSEKEKQIKKEEMISAINGAYSNSPSTLTEAEKDAHKKELIDAMNASSTNR